MRILVDTNVLMRSVEHANPLMRPARQTLKRLLKDGNELCIAPQIIAEFWSVCTRPVSSGGLDQLIRATDRLVSRIELLFVLLQDSADSFRYWRRLIVT